MIGIMFQDRLNYRGDLTPVLRAACAAYGIGELSGHQIIETGYEDCNLKIETTAGNYLLKIFSKHRTANEIKRLLIVLERVRLYHIPAPRLYDASGNGILFRDPGTGLGMVCMDWIDGGTFFELKKTPNDAELRMVMSALVGMGEIELPDGTPPMHSEWDIRNLYEMFDRVKGFITNKDELELCNYALSEWDKVPVDRLPTAFCHADIIKQNCIRGNDGRIYLIDFSLADVMPRIQAASIIAYSLLYGNGNTLLENAAKTIAMYGEYADITDTERRFFPNYCMAAAAMEYLGSIKEKHIGGDFRPETDYLIQNGLDGMKSYAGCVAL